ncbi:MAG: phosphodiester glycosidase family protein [Bdellovibrionales bacterium]|nr:phosphodiester glycosidase family protein [Bdellovibrionales bacterium]
MRKKRLSSLKKCLIAVVLSIVLLFPAVFLTLALLRPARTSFKADLFRGVQYERIALANPRPVLIHIVKVKVADPSISFFVTQPSIFGDDVEIPASTTSKFLESSKVKIAINANFFRPFFSKGPFNFYPHQGDLVNVTGLAISKSKQYSQASDGWRTFCVGMDKSLSFGDYTCPKETIYAVAGSGMLLKSGRINVKLDKRGITRDPQTAIGISKDGDFLYLVVVDGRQIFYSEGMTPFELAEFLLERDVASALLLDGGGSSTLVAEIDGKPTVLNSPIHTHIPLRQRAVANHFGVFVNP